VPATRRGAWLSIRIDPTSPNDGRRGSHARRGAQRTSRNAADSDRPRPSTCAAASLYDRLAGDSSPRMAARTGSLRGRRQPGCTMLLGVSVHWSPQMDLRPAVSPVPIDCRGGRRFRASQGMPGAAIDHFPQIVTVATHCARIRPRPMPPLDLGWGVTCGDTKSHIHAFTSHPLAPSVRRNAPANGCTTCMR
jgi:hypothetical protein